MTRFARLPLSELILAPQVRKAFDEESLRRLGESLKLRGLSVQPDGTIFAGARVVFYPGGSTRRAGVIGNNNTRAINDQKPASDQRGEQQWLYTTLATSF